MAALLLAGAGFAVAATRDSDSDTETTVGAPLGVGDTTTTFVLPTTELPVTSTTPPTTTGATTTTRRGVTTTTSRATTSTTVRSSTTSTTSAKPGCKAEQIDVKVDTDKLTYTGAQVVQVTSTLRNKSTSTCYYNGYSVGTSFKDDAGHTWPGPTVIADSFADVALKPGDVLTHKSSWDHKACPEPGCASLPPNPYYVTVTWSFSSFRYEALISFILS